MKRILAILATVTFLGASLAVAAGPDKVTLKAKNGDVTFDHKKHAGAMECKVCHGDAAPGKLTLDKDAAHKLCKDCHQTKGAGPTKCGDCHKK